MAARLSIFYLTLMIAQPLATEFPSHWTIWNIGQGQWVTYRTEEACYHFDTGGEFAPWPDLMKACRDKLNLLSYSHWDWDHVNFANRLRNALPQHCVLLRPSGDHSPKKAKLFQQLPDCSVSKPFQYWSPRSGSSANEMSRVFLWKGILLPGDSPIAQEKIWVHALKNLDHTRWLIIGHHGSRTSTGQELLTRLKHLKGAVASARRSRYGHPHFEVQRALEERKIPLLTTEDWGHIYIYD